MQPRGFKNYFIYYQVAILQKEQLQFSTTCRYCLPQSLRGRRDVQVFPLPWRTSKGESFQQACWNRSFICMSGYA